MSKPVNDPGSEPCGAGRYNEFDVFFHLCRRHCRLITVSQNPRDFMDAEVPGTSTCAEGTRKESRGKQL